MKEQGATGKRIGILFILFLKLALEDEGEIGIFVTMPINIIVGIFCIGNGYAIKRYFMIMLSKILSSPQVVRHILSLAVLSSTELEFVPINLPMDLVS